MKRIFSKTALALALGAALGAGGAAGGAGPFAGAVAQAAEHKQKHPGKRKYRRMTCIACHGRNGARAIQDYPNLAGQPKDYIVRQTMDIISGRRAGGLNAQGKPRAEAMRGALVTPDGKARIGKADVEEIADWLSALPPAAPRPPEGLKVEDIAAGGKLYKKKNCKTCHGPRGDRPLKGHPFIAGQKYEYIVNQMKDVRDKKRANARIKTMFPFVRKLTDTQIGQIAAWLSTQDRTAK